MKHALLIIIRIYWFVIPERKRKNCLFSESCSRFVYRETESRGFVSGIIAFKNRYNSCRPGYEIVRIQAENVILLKLANGEVLQENSISKTIVYQYKQR